jgi:hypothetical protein
MITKLWEKLGEGVGEKLGALALGGAGAFWLAGVAVLGVKLGWAALQDPFDDATTAAKVAAALVGVLVLLATGTCASAMQGPLIRLAEGYWPWPIRRLRFRRAASIGASLLVPEAEWQTLAAKPVTSLDAKDLARFMSLDAELRRYPVDPRLLLPTRLGNLLRGAEEAPAARYGLDIDATWPALWLVLPDGAKTEIAAARARVDAAGQSLSLSALFAAWVLVPPFLSWPSLAVVVVSVAGLWLSYMATLRAGASYADLLRAAYDLYRFDLYDRLRWPVPSGPSDERAAGEALSVFLYRGESAADAQYVAAPGEGKLGEGPWTGV